MMFRNRQDAGRRLAGELLRFRDQSPVVLALPRGGVAVAFEIAAALRAPLDVVLVRKLGAPGMEELAIGAIADGAHPEKVIDETLVRELGVSPAYLDQAIARQTAEIERRRTLYLKGRPPAELRGRCVLMVDDGIATGSTMRAALLAARRQKPARLVLAVPVAPAATLDRLRAEVDEIVCLSTPEDFYAIGQFYRDFHQMTDDEVIALLDHAAEALQAPMRP